MLPARDHDISRTTTPPSLVFTHVKAGVRLLYVHAACECGLGRPVVHALEVPAFIRTVRAAPYPVSNTRSRPAAGAAGVLSTSARQQALPLRHEQEEQEPHRNVAGYKAPDAAWSSLLARPHNRVGGIATAASGAASGIVLQPPDARTLLQLRSLQQRLSDEWPKYTACHTHCKVTGVASGSLNTQGVLG